MGAQGHQPLGDEAKVVLGALLPIASVDKDVHRRPTIAGQEDVECFLGGGSIGDVCAETRHPAGRLVSRLPISEVGVVVGVPRTIVILGVERHAVIRPEDGVTSH